MNRVIVIVFSLFLFLFGCRTLFASNHTYQKSNTSAKKPKEYETYQISNNLLGATYIPEVKRSFIYLNAEKNVWQDGTFAYYLVVEYQGAKWLSIEKGKSLELFVDEENIILSGKGSSAHRKILPTASDTVEEKAWYRVTPTQLKKIANAMDVIVVVLGKHYHSKRFFTEYNFDNFQRFYNDYVK